jgi:hypothetical protein
MSEQLMAHRGARKITYDELMQVPTPEATDSFKPIPHHSIVDEITTTLALRQVSITAQEFAVTPDGNRFFGVLQVSLTRDDFAFSIGVRNSHNKSMRFGLCAGARIFVCDNLAFRGDFNPVLAKHTKNFDLKDAVALGVDKIHRQFDPFAKQIDQWKARAVSDLEAKAFFYDLFLVEEKFSAKLMPTAHSFYFGEKHIRKGTAWAIHNSMTSTFGTLEPVKQFELTAKFGDYFQKVNWG